MKHEPHPNDITYAYTEGQVVRYFHSRPEKVVCEIADAAKGEAAAKELNRLKCEQGLAFAERFKRYFRAVGIALGEQT